LVNILPGARVTISAARPDAHARTWTAVGEYVAEADGRIDVDTSPSLGGSYEGVSAHGLWCSALPVAPGQLNAYLAELPQHPELGTAPSLDAFTAYTVELTARIDGKVIATATATRTYGAGIVPEEVTAAGGVRGLFFPAAAHEAQKVPVVVVAGSGGGLPDLQAALLASHGHPALAQGVFGYKDLPTTLREIPLETFQAGARWLKHRTGTARVAIMGTSRGSEAAGLAASYFPEDFAAAVLYVPSHLSNGAFGPGIKDVVDEAIDLIERHAVAMTISATTFLQELLDAAERRGTVLASLKAFACGGASVPPALIHRANRMLAPCRSFRAYGATEVPLIGRGCVDPDDDATAAETDGIIVDFEVKILLDDGRAAADGVEGEILARGAAQCVGYVDAEATRNSFDAEGYFHTGDLGFRTPKGALVITGRKKDLIIRGGENISAKEIEDILILHPAVRDVAVVSMPHVRLGEAVCAFVISSNPALSLRDLVCHLEKAGIARQKFPERLELVEDMPRTPAGKIKKDVLRTLAATAVVA
jgi:AMP-binding enzyme/AMP-binding enzyme C-terminal domain/Acyl-CoA thioester hydrolase/BAAT N-terminal region/BAAT / Acyl-CoA thioester hydrolase C terminal